MYTHLLKWLFCVLNAIEQSLQITFFFNSYNVIVFNNSFQRYRYEITLAEMVMMTHSAI